MAGLGTHKAQEQRRKIEALVGETMIKKAELAN